ncbi:MAG: hypothetical protein ACYCV7_07530 [Acidimicrobiales bacterium]
MKRKPVLGLGFVLGLTMASALAPTALALTGVLPISPSRGGTVTASAAVTASGVTASGGTVSATGTVSAVGAPVRALHEGARRQMMGGRHIWVTTYAHHFPVGGHSEPVVLTGGDFPAWSAGPELTAHLPAVPTNYDTTNIQQYLPGPLQSNCYSNGRASNPVPNSNNHGDHNCYQQSQLPITTLPGRTGVNPNRIVGYRWDPRAACAGQGANRGGCGRFVQTPLQVDRMFPRYLSNNASGFAFYSGYDYQLAPQFNREGFRFTANPPFNPANPAVACQSIPQSGVNHVETNYNPQTGTTLDPVQSLHNEDQISFMDSDAGVAAPKNAPLPTGTASAYVVRVRNPSTGRTGYVYVMLSTPSGPHRYFTAANSPYVHYQRDPNAGLFVRSQSSYSNYGNAPYGPVCTPNGRPVIGQGFKKTTSGALVLDPSTYVQRRPLDTAWLRTPRYDFRYAGRWLMDQLRVSPTDAGNMTTGSGYGPNVIDRWKGRAFQLQPGEKTPCCGYEEEQNNWGGSSELLGERWGPVRVIRATWGADSATNFVRMETFYWNQMQMTTFLRVHPVPPLDGLFSMWDYAAGRMTTYYNPTRPNGVTVDGINPQLFGNETVHAGTLRGHASVTPSGVSQSVSPDGLSLGGSDQLFGLINGGRPVAVGSPDYQHCNLHVNGVTAAQCVQTNAILPDPTLQSSPLLGWEEMTGPYGTTVSRYHIKQITAGVGYTVVTQPYYRDDSCFDDGTGSDPGPEIAPRSASQPGYWGYYRGVPLAGTTSPGPYQFPPGTTGITPRRCWNHYANGTPYNIPGSTTYNASLPPHAADPPPNHNFSPEGDVRYFQGSIGTDGVHIEFIADSDNAAQTLPVDEMDITQTLHILPGGVGNVGQAYAGSLLPSAPMLVSAVPGGSSLPTGRAVMLSPPVAARTVPVTRPGSVELPSAPGTLPIIPLSSVGVPTAGVANGRNARLRQPP